MNNPIQSVFSIKDLENLSGIKAHTIRIWEKRYNLLSPMRTEANIRYYDLDNLQKLLNVTLLHRHGYKISKIGSIPAHEIPAVVRGIVSEKSAKFHAITAFKLAMMDFDSALFYRTYDELLQQRSVKQLFFEVLLPLMEEIGLLWQSSTITPAHEHFISHLVRQKLLAEIERLQHQEPVLHDRVFVLFLPEGEMHSLGLLYLHYEIVNAGYKSIFLGESVPMGSLADLAETFPGLVYVSYFTIAPERHSLDGYLERFCEDVLSNDSELWLLGRQIAHLSGQDNRIKAFTSLENAVNNL